ncbi:MAG: proton-conducting transporter membrane subunit [Bryobacteraceae bacterium]
MDWGFWLPVLVLATSALAAALIFPLGERRIVARTTINMAAAVVKLGFVAIIFWGTFEGYVYETRLPFIPGLDFLLRVDPISLVFVSLSASLWLVTTIYAIGYLENSPRRSRFFGFFSLCVTATVGVALAGNLVTFFIFYELLTLATYPLVVHRATEASLTGGRTYLMYTLSGGTVLLAAIIWLTVIAGPVEFTIGGVLGHIEETHRGELIAIFALFIAGLGVKAALVPLHGWLPAAMIAPAPVSALLHAVAVVKAGAYGIIRVVYELYGLGLADTLGVLDPLAIVAGVTILFGSVRALAQDELKRRLAYSTVSQVSYIVLGVAIFGPLATTGGLVHLVHQGIMKITLFFCAGSLAETLEVHYVSEMNGVGRRMPLTMAAFTVAAFGMIGAPPIAGFVSKWYLGLGGIQADRMWVVAVLAASTLLNAGYFLPILRAAWFKEPTHPWPAAEGRETRRSLLIPSLVTALASLAAGLFAASDFSPLFLARLIAEGMYWP